MPEISPQFIYSYKDYLTWPENERWELIDGVAYNMTPAPSRLHQKIYGALFNVFFNYLKGKTCEVYGAPFDVRLGGEKDEDVKTVVQPDIVIVCDRSKLDERGCKGSPDLVVEITSSATLARDLKEKFYLYERSGVKEYWLVYPEQKLVVVYHLVKERYGRPQVYAAADQVSVGILEGMAICLHDIFED